MNAYIHINSEAIRLRSPEVFCERSACRFMDRLGLNTDGGSSYNLFMKQMKAIAAAHFTLGFNAKGKCITLYAKPISRFESREEGNGRKSILWPGIVVLSQEYFQDLLEHAVPLDGRALRALTHSALAIDAYSFFARRLYVLKKPLKISWKQFHAQFGQEYTGDDAVRNLGL